jgi:glycosyltransferase involved in cell wall biosynthesis
MVEASMRIALLAPIWETVPPPAYGGIELVVGLLAEGLVDLGHEVTLFASGDSVTRARLAAVQDRALRHMGWPWFQCLPHEQLHTAHCFERAREFDVIHNHLGTTGLPFARFVDVPTLTTLHGPFDEHNRDFFARYADLPFVSISDAQRVGGPALDYRATIYNGLDTTRYHLGRKGGYLLHLGRVSHEKGTHVAIEVARRAGFPLVIAGKIDPVDQAYYEAEVLPLLDGERIRFIGEVGGAAKYSLLAEAEALIHPVQWPEPFGLAMAEAMASGTPVLAFRLGSIPEVVEPGLTGFVVDSVEAMVQAIPWARRLDPMACRRRAVERFGARRMVREYAEAFEELAQPRVRITRLARPDVAAERPMD